MTIGSYVSKLKKTRGKNRYPLILLLFKAVPAWDQIPYQWALAELVKAQPDDFIPETYAGYVNPYMFAGGKVKDEPEAK
ncbi:Uncharacterised protein [Actinobacillus pleuropneumoniae]|nr:Uncharacterised protein [Actinobacillus pleuropneumoniae]